MKLIKISPSFLLVLFLEDPRAADRHGVALPDLPEGAGGEGKQTHQLHVYPFLEIVGTVQHLQAIINFKLT